MLCALQLGGDLGGGLDRPGPRIRRGGQPTRDAHAHRLRTILAARRGPYWPVAPSVLALFGPTGVGKTDVAIALAERIRARGGHPVAVSADALQVYARPGDPHRACPTRAQRARLEHRLVVVPAGRRALLGRPSTPRSPTPRSTGCSPTGATPIVVGGTGLYLRAALARARAAPAAAAGRARALAGEMDERGPAALHAELAHGGAARGRADRPARPPPHRARARAARAGRAATTAAAGAQPPLDRRHAPPDAPRRPRPRPRRALRAHRAPRRRDGGGRRDRGGPPRGRGRRVGDRARRAGLRASCCTGDVEAMKRRTRRYARRQLTWMRKLPDVELVDITGREPEARRGGHRLRARMSPTGFEKWQALGNDYLIFEERRAAVRADAGAHPAHLRRPHRHRLRRDPAALRARRAGLRRAAADLQPRRLGVRAVGQRRARGGHVPAPQRLDGRRPLLDPDRRRRDPPAHHRAGHLHAGHGPRAHASEDFPAGDADGAGAARGGRAHVALSARRRSATRSARSTSPTPPSSTRLDLPAIGRGDHGARAVSQPHERLLVRRARARRHPRADLRARRGGDDVLGDGRQRRRDRLRPARRRLARSPSASTAASCVVDVGEDLHFDLTGWARPVYRGELADDFCTELENL